MNPINGMVMVPIMTPYGTQLLPMTMNQILTQYGVGNNQATGKNAHANAQANANMAQQQLNQLQLQQQLQVQAALLAKNQQNLVNFGLNQTGSKTNGNQIGMILFFEHWTLTVADYNEDLLPKNIPCDKCSTQNFKKIISIFGSFLW